MQKYQRKWMRENNCIYISSDEITVKSRAARREEVKVRWAFGALFALMMIFLPDIVWIHLHKCNWKWAWVFEPHHRSQSVTLISYNPALMSKCVTFSGEEQKEGLPPLSHPCFFISATGSYNLWICATPSEVRTHTQTHCSVHQIINHPNKESSAAPTNWRRGKWQFRMWLKERYFHNLFAADTRNRQLSWKMAEDKGQT